MAAQLCKVKGCPHLMTEDTYFCKQTHQQQWISSPERLGYFQDWKDEWTKADMSHAYELAVANFCIRLQHEEPTPKEPRQCAL